jgi:hypothetical protein
MVSVVRYKVRQGTGTYTVAKYLKRKQTPPRAKMTSTKAFAIELGLAGEQKRHQQRLLLPG